MAYLVFEVEFLTGVSVAASPFRRDETEWPPHPDRLFQALVSAWGRNDPPDEAEREALEWLERLDSKSLAIQAPKAHRREVVKVFVPTNNYRTTGKVGSRPPTDLAEAVAVVPALRQERKDRYFPAALPAADRPVVRYLWRLAEADERTFRAHRAALERLAREVTYLGHSHSLVRVTLLDEAREPTGDGPPWLERTVDLRVPYPGRLQRLHELYQRAFAENRAQRPQPSLVVRRFHARSAVEPATVFDPDSAVVLGDGGGFTPALAAFPLVAKRLRDALLRCAPSDTQIPALLSGHDEDGRPLQEPHIAIMPMADVGWPFSQGRLMGLAMVWPRGAGGEERRSVLQILAAFLRLRGDGRGGLLHFGRRGSWSLALVTEADRASLRFARYAGPARRWGTVLPVVLDRHPKKNREQVSEIVCKACLNIGLPEDALDGLEVEVHQYSPVQGAPSVHEVRAALPVDSPYRTRPLAHLVLTFARQIRGPLILGAGRYRGLGLCLPLDGKGT